VRFCNSLDCVSRFCLADIGLNRTTTKKELFDKVASTVESHNITARMYRNHDEEEDDDDDDDDDDPATGGGDDPLVGPATSHPGDYIRLINVVTGEVCRAQYATIGTHTSRASVDNHISPLKSFNQQVHTEYHSDNVDYDLGITDSTVANPPDPMEYTAKTVPQLVAMRKKLEQEYNKINAQVTTSGNHLPFRDFATGNTKIMHFHDCIEDAGGALRDSVTAMLPASAKRQSGPSNKQGLAPPKPKKSTGNRSKKVAASDANMEKMAESSEKRTAIMAETANQLAEAANLKSYHTSQDAVGKLRGQIRDQRAIVKKFENADTQDSAHQDEVAHLEELKTSLANAQGMAKDALAKIAASKQDSA
jgi:hypothetical protein